MKSMICLLALMLVLICMPTGNVVSLDHPYYDDPGTGNNDPGGDDHPWGGNGSTGENDGGERNYTSFTATGIGALDFVFNTPFIGSYVQSWFFGNSYILMGKSRVIEQKKEDKPSQPTGSTQNQNGDF